MRTLWEPEWDEVDAVRHQSCASMDEFTVQDHKVISTAKGKETSRERMSGGDIELQRKDREERLGCSTKNDRRT